LALLNPLLHSVWRFPDFLQTFLGKFKLPLSWFLIFQKHNRGFPSMIHLQSPAIFGWRYFFIFVKAAGLFLTLDDNTRDWALLAFLENLQNLFFHDSASRPELLLLFLYVW
jgi:hypothetical protein